MTFYLLGLQGAPPWLLSGRGVALACFLTFPTAVTQTGEQMSGIENE